MLLTILLIDYERILDKYGWPALGLFIIGLIFYKAVWPRISQAWDDSRNANRQALEDARVASQKASQVMERRASMLEERESTFLNDFKKAIELSSQRTEKQIEILTDVASTVHRIDYNTERDGRRGR